jgi:hypothetical protein
LDTKDMDLLRQIGAQEERSLSWLIGKMLLYCVSNWSKVREQVTKV